MTTTENIDVRSYCDVMFDELTDMRSRVLDLTGCIDEKTGQEKELLKSHISHLHDIADTIEWKLQILTKVCPADWKKYSQGAEDAVSVEVPDTFEEETVSPGYMGG